MKKYAIIVAGGSGQRMGNSIPKQFLLLRQKPVLWYTVRAFLTAYNDLQVILVLPAAYIKEGEQIIADLQADNRVTIAEGGTTRFHSVQNGLQLVKEPAVVFVHDGVRCLVSRQLIRRCYETALEKGSAIPAIAATDSIRIVQGNTHQVADREHIRIIQTPQTFLSSLLLPAFNTAYQEQFTDEATVVEYAGHPVFLVEGEHHNIKITRPVDLMIAEQMLPDY